jgi:hypothetical protein
MRPFDICETLMNEKEVVNNNNTNNNSAAFDYAVWLKCVEQ